MTQIVDISVLAKVKDTVEQLVELEPQEKEIVVGVIEEILAGDIPKLVEQLKTMSEEDRQDFLTIANMVLEEVTQNNINKIVENGSPEDLEFLAQYLTDKDKLATEALEKLEPQLQESPTAEKPN